MKKVKFETGRVFSLNPRCDGSACVRLMDIVGDDDEEEEEKEREFAKVDQSSWWTIAAPLSRSFGKIPKSD